MVEIHKNSISVVCHDKIVNSCPKCKSKNNKHMEIKFRPRADHEKSLITKSVHMPFRCGKEVCVSIHWYEASKGICRVILVFPELFRYIKAFWCVFSLLIAEEIDTKRVQRDKASWILSTKCLRAKMTCILTVLYQVHQGWCVAFIVLDFIFLEKNLKSSTLGTAMTTGRATYKNASCLRKLTCYLVQRWQRQTSIEWGRRMFQSNVDVGHSMIFCANPKRSYIK